MGPLDWIIIVGYMLGMIALSYGLSRGQKDGRDYYLGGNKVGPLPIALSTMATQCSTNSLLGAPAFVALSGGLLWLQYELAVPLAMIVIMVVIIPILRGLNLVSVYDYVERRYDVQTRVLLSILFQFLRAFSTGVTVYALALVLEFFMGIPFWVAVLLLGVVTVIYDVLGGIKAVIVSDVIQLFILVAGIVAAIWMALELNGGWAATWQHFDSAKAQTLDFAGHGWGDGATFAFWPMLFGGLFLYVSYYGCDQTQIQRELSSRSVAHSQISLFIGGILRFPLVALYCFLGVCLGAYLTLNPELLDSLKQVDSGEINKNLVMPAFMQAHFPSGLLGLVLAGFFAAAMSSLDSTINSLSTLTMHDIVLRFFKDKVPASKELLYSKMLTVFWGVICIVFAFFVGNVSGTVIEAVNKIGSLVNGPLLAVFLLGMLSKRVGSLGIQCGLILGFSTNVLLWNFAPDISWLWWNVVGFFVASGSAISVSLFKPARNVAKELMAPGKVIPKASNLRTLAVLLAVYFCLILLALEWVS
ncbi:MAG: sodium/solute symporter [Opitutales bacterium]|nr:sodium/solute symporter [Opitutales bacterium]NRA27525.1 sodium/solute symporter [Opitutales bacterium]